ncbi:MAG: hypothetical protein V9G18_16255 [Albidovulum sp.]
MVVYRRLSVPPRCAIGIGTDEGSTSGSELQFGAAIAYADTKRRFAIGPEAVLGTVVLGTDAAKPFVRDFTSLEVLLGAHYNIAQTSTSAWVAASACCARPVPPTDACCCALATRR